MLAHELNTVLRSRGVAPGSDPASFAQAVGQDKLIGAVDSRAGHVVIHGWKTSLPLTATEAVKALEPYCSEFLYTHVDTEGLMGGIPMDAVLAVSVPQASVIEPRHRQAHARRAERPGRGALRRPQHQLGAPAPSLPVVITRGQSCWSVILI